jgi:tripartite-type tricarboxylate transporter receptor subunit TctC
MKTLRRQLALGAIALACCLAFTPAGAQAAYPTKPISIVVSYRPAATPTRYLNEIIKSPEVVAKLATFGALPVGGAPEVLAKTNAAEYQTMGKLITDLAISAD